MMPKQCHRSAVRKLGGLAAAGAMVAGVGWLSTPSPATAANTAGFEVLCQVLDETRQTEKTEFQGGETAVLRLLVKIPEDVYDEQMKLRVLAYVKIKGFKYKVELPITDIDVPKKSERLSISGYTPDLQEFTPFRQLDTFNDVDVDAYLDVRLPNNVPKTKLILKAVGYIKGYGNQSCTKDIELVN
jgi:hypothetical protein